MVRGVKLLCRKKPSTDQRGPGGRVWECRSSRKGWWDRKNAVGRRRTCLKYLKNTVAFCLFSSVCMTSIFCWAGSLALLHKPSPRPVLHLLYSFFSSFIIWVDISGSMHVMILPAFLHQGHGPTPSFLRASLLSKQPDPRTPHLHQPQCPFCPLCLPGGSSSGLCATVTELWEDLLAWTSHKLSFLDLELS